MATINDNPAITALNSYATTSRRLSSDHFGLFQSVIDAEHWYIHAGVHFFSTATGIVDSGDFLYHSILTPAFGSSNIEVHLTHEFTGTDELLVELVEGPTGITPTTSPLNSRRASTNTPDARVDVSSSTGADLLSGGTVIDSWLVGSSGGFFAGPDAVTSIRGHELTLKPSTLYSYRFTSGGAGNRITSKLWHYEAGSNVFGV